jgi:hypothetical protein
MPKNEIWPFIFSALLISLTKKTRQDELSAAIYGGSIQISTIGWKAIQSSASEEFGFFFTFSFSETEATNHVDQIILEANHGACNQNLRSSRSTCFRCKRGI